MFGLGEESRLVRRTLRREHVKGARYIEYRQVCEKGRAHVVSVFVAEVGNTLFSITMPLTDTLQSTLYVHPSFFSLKTPCRQSGQLSRVIARSDEIERMQ